MRSPRDLSIPSPIMGPVTTTPSTATASAPTRTREVLTLTLDVPAHLLPSRTEGHQHLYLNAPMTWRTYKRLLTALAKTGVIEKNWAKASIKGRQTLLRPPGTAWGPNADPHLVYVLNPAHADIHQRHVWVRNEDREDRDGYSTYRYTVLVRTLDRTEADYVTSTLRNNDNLHAPALDIDIPATLTPDPVVPGRHILQVTLPTSLHPTRRARRRARHRLTKALTKAGIVDQQRTEASIA